MKNQQINKFLLMFFLSFTLFFSVSNAEFSTSPLTDGNKSMSFGEVSDENLIIENTNYSYKSVYEIIQNHFDNPDDANYALSYNSLISDFKLLGYDVAVFKFDSYYRFFYGEGISIGVNATYDRLAFVPLNGPSGTGTGAFTILTKVSGYNSVRQCNIVFPSSYANCSYSTTLSSLLYSNVSIKQLYFSGGYCWDGETYYYEVVTEPENPSANYDVASLVSSIILSPVIQNNTDGTKREYFITPNGTVGDEEVYELYFYNSRVNLSQFEYVYNNELYYDLEKTSVNGIIAKLVDLVGGYKGLDGRVNPLAEVKQFTMYYDPIEKTSDIFLTSERSIDTLRSFRSDINPIIYTTKDIAYYSATWAENDKDWTVTPNANKNILSVPVTDDDGNEISPVVPGSEAPLSSTPWETFVSFLQVLMNSLINKIGLLLESVLGLGLDFCNIILKVFGENVVTFVLVIVVKAITVLISSVALIFRFIGFVMTLVAIPASSALLAVDVAVNSSGLIFTGMNWGTRFIEGLDFIKTLQWNGLGLWTLFEVFVASLEVVLFVKIVRKHYRTL